MKNLIDLLKEILAVPQREIAIPAEKVGYETYFPLTKSSEYEHLDDIPIFREVHSDLVVGEVDSVYNNEKENHYSTGECGIYDAYGLWIGVKNIVKQQFYKISIGSNIRLITFSDKIMIQLKKRGDRYDLLELHKFSRSDIQKKLNGVGIDWNNISEYITKVAGINTEVIPKSVLMYNIIPEVITLNNAIEIPAAIFVTQKSNSKRKELCARAYIECNLDDVKIAIKSYTSWLHPGEIEKQFNTKDFSYTVAFEENESKESVLGISKDYVKNSVTVGEYMEEKINYPAASRRGITLPALKAASVS